MKVVRCPVLAAGAILIGIAATSAQAPPPQVRVISIGDPIPLAVAQSQDLFARYGIQVTVTAATNSTLVRESLKNGTADIAHSTVDNSIALAESGTDVVIVVGGETTSRNELVAQPEIQSIAGLRGKTVIVDAPNTGYALQLKKILLVNGLKPGEYDVRPLGSTPQRFAAMREHKEYAATILNGPLSIRGGNEGLKSLALVSAVIGPYQGLGAFVRRDWAKEHADVLVAYLAAYVAAQRWFADPANKARATEVVANLSHLSPAEAAVSYQRSAQDAAGPGKDARIDMDALRTVLKLHAEIEGEWNGQVPPPEKYVDLTYYNRALARLNTSQ